VEARVNPCGKVDIEAEILAVDPGDGAAVEPDISPTVKALAAKMPGASASRRVGQNQRPSIDSSPGVAFAAVLKGVAAVPTVGEVDLLARFAAPGEPSATNPSACEFPAIADVVAQAERSFDHRALS
jgi:hypothetical protein